MMYIFPLLTVGRLSTRASDEEAVAGSFTAVACVANVKHHVLVLYKKLIDDGKQCEANVWIFGCTRILCFGKAELPSLTAANRLLLKEPNFVVYAVLSFKNELLVVKAHFIWSLGIDAVEVENLHADMVVTGFKCFSAQRFLTSCC